jgi:carbon storage regulator CsrA
VLVLTRRKNESLVINNDIALTVVEIRGDKVRLGVVCPKDVPVHRQEVYDAIHGVPRPPRSPVEAALLRAVLADPADDSPRLIYADWLDEQGDPRGKFVRVQCRLAQLPPGDEAVSGLRRREQELLDRHGPAWRSALPPLLRNEFFCRGFVESVHLTVREFVLHAEELLGSAPIRHLHLRPFGWSPTVGDIASLAASPYLARLETLDLGQNGLGHEDISHLAGSAHLAGLKTLLLRENGIGDAGAAALARSLHLVGLTVLDLAGNRIGTVGARELAKSARLCRLTRLDMTGNPVGEEGRRALLARFAAAVQC